MKATYRFLQVFVIFTVISVGYLSLSAAQNPVKASYQIFCGEQTVTCQCDQCPDPNGYTCPGGQFDECLSIGCTCDPQAVAANGKRGVCNGPSGKWSSCNGGAKPATPPPGSTPQPSPPAGSCGSCSSCGAATSGECAMINGVCSKAGYCSGGGGFTGCKIWDPPAVNVLVGQSKTVNIAAFAYGDIILGYNAVVLDPTVFTSSPLGISMCCSTNYGSFGVNVLVTGLKQGTAWMSTRYGTSGNNDTDFCTNLLRVNVTANPTLPTITLKANGQTGGQWVASGTDITLDWQTTNVDTCTASGGWSGSKALSGTELKPNVTTNTTYTLDCTGPNGNVSASADISILGSPAIPYLSLSINGSSSPIVYTVPNPAPATNVTLRWTSLNATSCVGASTPWPTSACGVGYYYFPCPYTGTFMGYLYWDKSQVLTNGTMSVPSWDSTYSMTCTGPGGSVRRQVQVITSPPNTQCTIPQPQDPAPPVCALNPPTSNGSIVWTWPAVRNADQYSVEIVDATSGAVVAVPTLPSGFVNGQINYNCRMNQTPADTCSVTTVLPPGSYRSRIQARSSTNVCLPSSVATYPPVNLPGVIVDLCPAEAWWQSGDGSIFTQGNIQSIIPPTCNAANSCNNNLIQDNNGIPALAIGGLAASVQTGTGNVSSKNWLAKSTINGRVPDYAAFVSLIPVSITPSDTGATCGGGTFNAGGATTGDGYYWYRHNGDVSITSDVNLNAGRKVILYVDGNLAIHGKITYNPANAYFMPIVKGDITVDPAVTTPAGTNTFTGIFYCDGKFSTGVGNAPFSVWGSVVAKGGVTLERDLGTGNHYESSEKFSSCPDLNLNYPGALSFKRPIWHEVAP